MKATLYDISGKKKGEIEMPEIFNNSIREDLAMKLYETFKERQEYSNSPRAGKRHSASGTISHKRHDWKGHYGHGMSRIPRKIMWRRGTQFFWVGAEISGTRGGRQAHPPRLNRRPRKINMKEISIGMNSAYAATANKEFLDKRYSSLTKTDIKLPVVIESKLEKIKTKDFIQALKNIFSNAFGIVLQKKEVRAGKGKLRNRRYKSNAGLLLVTGKNEKVRMSGIDIVKVNDVVIEDLYPLGRLTLYTENAVKEFGGKK